MRSSVRSALLLAVFVIGGMGAPWLHERQHDAARRQQQGAESRRYEAARALGAEAARSGFLEEAVEVVHDLFCHHCLQHLAGTTSQPPATATGLRPEALVVAGSSYHSQLSCAHRPIRAPPLTA